MIITIDHHQSVLISTTTIIITIKITRGIALIIIHDHQLTSIIIVISQSIKQYYHHHQLPSLINQHTQQYSIIIINHDHIQSIVIKQAIPIPIQNHQACQSINQHWWYATWPVIIIYDNIIIIDYDRHWLNDTARHTSRGKSAAA